jgi:hypothetical protein
MSPSLEVQYSTRGLTCGSLASGRMAPTPSFPVVSRRRLSYLARIWHGCSRKAI